MDEPDFFLEYRLAIVGLGLMGGSLALALKGKCTTLLGIDIDPEIISLALQSNIVDQASTKPEELLPRADLVILATPLRAILAYLKELPRLHPGASMIMDLGSSKVDVVHEMQSLPERFDPLGGHPMCGKERGSLVNADGKLFRGNRFAFTPLQRTSESLRAAAAQLAQIIGAQALWIDPQTHDRWVSATSHLPYIIANILAQATPEESKPLVGPGFRSSTRLAGTSPDMMMDVLVSNRSNILASMVRFRESIGYVEEMIAREEWESLQELLSRGANCYSEFIGKEEAT